jgi:hypothetical protein
VSLPLGKPGAKASLLNQIKPPPPPPPCRADKVGRDVGCALLFGTLLPCAIAAASEVRRWLLHALLPLSCCADK